MAANQVSADYCYRVAAIGTYRPSHRAAFRRLGQHGHTTEFLAVRLSNCIAISGEDTRLMADSIKGRRWEMTQEKITANSRNDRGVHTMKYVACALLAAFAAFGAAGCASIFPGSSSLISQYSRGGPESHPWVPQYQGASAAAATSGPAGPMSGPPGAISGPAGPIVQANRDAHPWLPQYQGASAVAATSAPAASASAVPPPPIPPVAATQ
jgi:hypothetical protein